MNTGNEQESRDYLTGTIRLSRHEDGNSPETYKIGQVIGEGGTVVCYEATRTLSDGVVESGRLKEFYPIDTVSGENIRYISMRRLSDGQLVPGPGSMRKFARMKKDFVDSYKLLYKVMAESPGNEILKSYIQHGEILYGISQSDRRAVGADPLMREMTTVYIWSSGFAGEGFDQWIDHVRNHPTAKPERTLQTILTIFASVTDFARVLHTAGLVHLDIKPSNFMVQYDSSHQIRPDSISVFDINSMHTWDSCDSNLPWSEGFSAPELRRGKADNRSDIYSIGAMLFYALIIARDISDGRYHDYYYPSISRLLKNSDLFTCSEVNSDARLLSRLCRILEGCLAQDPKSRYQSCTQLLADFRAAQKRMDRLLNTPLPKSEKGLTDPTIVIQKLLYEHPLYEALPQGKKAINVLVLGAGNYGQRFIDLALQAGQMEGFRLSITAASDEPQRDREDYLKFRPAMSDFVNVNGSSPADSGSTYADLQFIPIGAKTDGATDGAEEETHFGAADDENREIVLYLLDDRDGKGSPYDYIFVSLGDSTISRKIAEICADTVSGMTDRSCPVCYVTRNRKKPGKQELSSRVYPVNIIEPIELDHIARGLGEMAFNTHLSWLGSMNMDIARVRDEFFNSTDEKERYNRSSSLSYALSIPYKLYSIFMQYEDLAGFAPHITDRSDEAAEIFQKRILNKRTVDPKAKRLLAQITDLEHRRWLLQMAADGWTAPRKADGSLDFESCLVRGVVKDTANRTHPCMVKGSAAAPLSSAAYQNDHHKKWDEGKLDPDLDELDRMSVELHRFFRKKAEELRTRNLHEDPDIRAIEEMLPADDENIRKAFVHFRYALRNAIAGEESYCRQYGEYAKALGDAAQSLPIVTAERIRERLEMIRRTCFPAVESGLYRDYKAYDEVLVRKIPFILTFRYAPSLALAFQDGRFENGRNEAVFPDVASAALLGPERIHYLYCFDSNSDESLLIRKLDAVLHIFAGRKVRCIVEMAAAVLEEVPASVRKALTKGFEDLRKKYEGHVVLKPLILKDAENYSSAAAAFERYLSSAAISLYDASTLLFPSAMDQKNFIARLRRDGVPCFELDWRRKAFLRSDGCSGLQYLEDHSFLRAADLFDLMNVADSSCRVPEFAEDYQKLWAICTGSDAQSPDRMKKDIESWNRLCQTLKQYENSRIPLARMKLPHGSSAEIQTLKLLLPSYTGSVVRILLRELRETGIAMDGSALESYSESMLRLTLNVDGDHISSCRAIFRDPKYLIPFYQMRVDRIHDIHEDENYVEVLYFDEHAANVDLAADIRDKKGPKYSLEVLRQLEQAGFIANLVSSPASPYIVSFDYLTPGVKNLLTRTGDLLEIYTYYDVLKTGYFDDVKTGCEFDWEAGGVRNKLDLVLTRGFRSMIVEFRPMPEPGMEYDHRLHSIVRQFGIGTICVLIGNTCTENTGNVSDGQLCIRTLHGAESMQNIGKELVRIMQEEM